MIQVKCSYTLVIYVCMTQVSEDEDIPPLLPPMSPLPQFPLVTMMLSCKQCLVVLNNQLHGLRREALSANKGSRKEAKKRGEDKLISRVNCTFENGEMLNDTHIAVANQLLSHPS